MSSKVNDFNLAIEELGLAETDILQTRVFGYDTQIERYKL